MKIIVFLFLAGMGTGLFFLMQSLFRKSSEATSINTNRQPLSRNASHSEGIDGAPSEARHQDAEVNTGDDSGGSDGGDGGGD